MAIEITYHADMLGDEVRLRNFRAAIRKCVEHSDNVVDIGSGIGPLAACAIDSNARTVTAVEYIPELARISEAIFAGMNVSVINGRSYDTKFDHDPDVVITETIGQVGPEENIVEITRDLMIRYPGIRLFIPRRLVITVQPAHSVEAHNLKKNVIGQILDSASGSFQPSLALDRLESGYSKQIIQAISLDVRPFGESTRIADYVMGTTANSDFVANVETPAGDWNVLCIAFTAELCDTIAITNDAFSEHSTHWGISYIYRDAKSTSVDISYCSRTTEFTAEWK